MPAHPSPRFGYLLATAAAAMWALNGSLARFLLDDGVGALRLAQLRALGSLVLLVALVALWRPGLLRVPRKDLPQLAFLGIAGLAGVHATYFLAIERLQIGAALTIQYMGPLLILVWLRLVHGREVRRALWAAAGLSLIGCLLVVRAYEVTSLDALGVLAAVGAAITFAIYLLASERSGRRHQPATTLVWAFGFASLFWALLLPLWTFPAGRIASSTNALLALGVIVIGTLVPFALMVAAVRHIPASRAAVVATLEPVLAALIAWPIHAEALAAPQIAGGLAVVGAVVWMQTQAIAPAVDAAPEQMSSFPGPVGADPG